MPSIRETIARHKAAQTIDKAATSVTNLTVSPAAIGVSVAACLPPQKVKKPVSRKCCNTLKGDSPHEPGCKMLAPAKPRQPKRPPLTFRGRKPDGARYEFTYDAKAEMWTGVLSIPGRYDPITATNGSVRYLWNKLDDAWSAMYERKDG